MHLTAWITLAAIAVYFWTVVNVGRARVAYKVFAPSVDGPPPFQRCLRVQMNTLEQMPLFLPSLWMCGLYLGDGYGAAGGALWCVGRIVYARAYYRDPASRSLGFGLGMLAGALLFVGAATGLIMR